MTSASPEKFLTQEREQTDGSLTTERGAADQSLLEKRKQAEQESDDQVKKDRSEADQVRAQNRTARDSKMSSEDHMDAEVVDGTVEEERTIMDAAIKSERAQKNAVFSKFLQEEREETDDNLLREREKTDVAVLHSTKLLNDEYTSHSLTKTELTTRDEFLAIVSHDLRNPIGAVLSCANMLLEDSSHPGIGKEAKYWLEFIKRNSETSLRLISDLLDMERIAEGKLQLESTEHDIGELLRDSTEAFVHLASAKGVLLKASFLKSLQPIYCDRDRIAQVLSNLIGNALKFTPEGGSIELLVEDTGDEIKFSVKDTGPGIPKDQKKHIFDRHSQINNKDRRGLGLGLYISKKLIETHKGKLWVTSSVGKGSTFCFTLPKSVRS